MNRRSFVVRVTLGLGAAIVAAVVGAKDAFAQNFRPVTEDDELPLPPTRYRNRLDWNIHERIWLRMWQIENKREQGINNGLGVLDHIVGRDPTPAEDEAVAGVMQWLGTNCGHGFLVETLEAQGYRIREDDSLENSAVVKKYRYLNGRLPKRIAIKRRGRTRYV